MSISYWSPGAIAGSSKTVLGDIWGPLKYFRSRPALKELVPVLTMVHLISKVSFGLKTVLSNGLRRMESQAYWGLTTVPPPPPPLLTTTVLVGGTITNGVAVGSAGAASVWVGSGVFVASGIKA